MTSWHFWKQPAQEVKALNTKRKILEKNLQSLCNYIGNDLPKHRYNVNLMSKIGILLALKLTCYSFPRHDGQGLLK